jgi:hypothetical protein
MPSFNRYYNVPSSVSRDLSPSNYSWDTVVTQSGRPILDAELNLAQEAGAYNRVLLSGNTLPSGFLRGQGSVGALDDYRFYLPGGGYPANSLGLPRLLAMVAGMPVVVEYSSSTTANENVVVLPAPTASSGVAPDIKRTDFVFLEVWRAQVAPSPRAYGWVEVNTPLAVTPGSTVTIDTTAVGGGAVVLTAVAGAPAVGQFQIGANSNLTAANLATAINNPLNGLSPYVTGNAHSSPLVQITATAGGVASNGITLAESTAGVEFALSGPTLTGGATRPNKPTDDTIYVHGNVQAPSGVNLPDDLVDPVLNVESTQRIQVQYRLRVYSSVLLGVNPKTQPDGFSNTAVLAQGTQLAGVAGYPFVPADNVSVSGSSDATAYGFLDNGLYIAGDGSSGAATALGTADGFVYAIPLCMVFRRNDASLTGGFNPTLNANGGISGTHAGFANTHLDLAAPVAIAAGESDRPDGLFCDWIAAQDVLDLRRHVTPPGYDFASELKYQTQSLLDQSMLTWQVDSSDMVNIASGSGGQSATPMVCDEIARSTDPAADIAGERIRTFDHIARRFGSQSVVERVVFEILPGGVYPPGITVFNSGTGWCEGDTISLDFTALDPSSLQDWSTGTGAVTVAGTWPVGTRVTDVLTVYHDDGHSTVPVDQQVQLSGVTGVGTTNVTVTLDYNPQAVDAGLGTMLVDVFSGADGSQRRIFLELEVTYPTGAGLQKTPRAPLTPSVASGYTPYNGGAIVEQDTTQRPSEMDPLWVPNPKFRAPFREVLLDQKSTLVVDSVVTRTANLVYPPRRTQTLTGLIVNGAPAASATLGSSQREITLGVPAAGIQVPVALSYVTQDAIPDSGTGYRLDVYYNTTAPQTCGVQSGAIPTNLLPTDLPLEPLAVSNHLWTGQTGAGSTELGFPYAVPLDAIPTSVPSAGYPKEWYFAATANISVSDFNADTGALTLHAMVPMDGSNVVTLGSSVAGRGTQIDAEFRAYYNYANHLGYKPTVMTQPLSGSVRHKVFTTMLVRSRERTRLFRKGELLLVVFSRFAELDADNKMVLADPLGTPMNVAAVYRTRNLLLTAGN